MFGKGGGGVKEVLVPVVVVVKFELVQLVPEYKLVYAVLIFIHV